jgi:hypothetical protein
MPGRSIAVTLPHEVATFAVSSVNNVSQTVYQHDSEINPSLGIYRCDCNGFAAFVLQDVIPDQYGKIQAQEEEGQPRPRAFTYFDFFAALVPGTVGGGWHRINYLKDVGVGDVLAWRFPTVEPHEDTGHVVIVREKATVDENGIYSVRVCDSSPVPHFDDTRASGTSGVGG